MKKTFTLCLLVASLNSFGQVLNSGFNQYETIACPFDSNVTINVYKDWLMYQTLDDKWDGPIDSSICLSLPMSNPNEGVDLNTADLSRPVFLRCKFTESNKALLYPNYIYNATTVAFKFGNPMTMFEAGTDCTDNFCSGLIIGIQIPNEQGTGTAMRWYTDIPGGDSLAYYFQTCIATEYFPESYLREFIIKLKPTQSTTPDQRIPLNYAQLENSDYPNFISDVVAPQFTFIDTSYQVPIEYAAEFYNPWEPNYVLRYVDQTSWPSSANPSFVEVRPESNTPDPHTINLIVDQYQTFIPQPFAFLRGALVEGSDSIRHKVNLINNGGDICMSGIVDFAFGEDTRYLHAGGHVNLEGMNACMMFRNGGTFEIADGVTMQYGQDGRGILALRSGGQLVMGRGSSLLFDGVLWLQGIPTAKHPDPQFYLDLKPGSSLVFGERANVLNANSTAPSVKLNVFMNGGTLDDSQLNPAARLLIHRIYPKPAKRFSENVQVLGNPVAGQFTLAYVSVGSEKVKLEVHDLQGRLVWSKSFDTVKGHNYLDGEFGAAAAGVYVATLSGKGGQAAVKLVKLD